MWKRRSPEYFCYGKNILPPLRKGAYIRTVREAGPYAEERSKT